MITQLKNQFLQSFFGTVLWLTTLCTLFLGLPQVNGTILYRVVAISLLVSFVFGVCYQWLWSFSVMKSSIKVVLCSVMNLSVAFLCVFLFSTAMYQFILPWAPAMLVVELVLHALTFHIYATYQNKKEIDALTKEL